MATSTVPGCSTVSVNILDLTFQWFASVLYIFGPLIQLTSANIELKI